MFILSLDNPHKETGCLHISRSNHAEEQLISLSPPCPFPSSLPELALAIKTYAKRFSAIKVLKTYAYIRNFKKWASSSSNKWSVTLLPPPVTNRSYSM